MENRRISFGNPLKKQEVTIISHLKPADWKLSWEDKVIADNEGSMAAYQPHTGYWGHFKNDYEFVLSYHREYEIKGMSLSQYFNGRIMPDEQGSKIVGTFGKKWSANLFLMVGAVLCLGAFIMAAYQMNLSICLTAGVLFIIILAVYLFRPEQGQKQIMEGLQEISFDDAFNGKGKPKRKQRTMRDLADADAEEETGEPAAVKAEVKMEEKEKRFKRMKAKTK